MTLIEELKQRRGVYEPASFESYPDELDVGVMRGIDIAIEIVKNHSDWIPASEPPKEDGTYLVQTKFNTYEILDYYTYCNRWDDDAHEIRCVIAWQPLPKPYEGERK